MKKIIRIVSPAKAIEQDYIEYAKGFLEANQFTVQIGEKALGKNYYFSGTDVERLSDFQAAIDDETVDVILCARGGYGSIRIVDQIDYSAIQKRPKLIIGFSDITVFHHHINRYFKLPSVHATMPLNFQNNTRESLTSLVNVINGKKNQYQLPPHMDNISGQAEGILIGGNLAIIYALIGTNSDVDFKEKILFIEDIGEYLYTIDRMFWALEKAGKLSLLRGLIIGGMTNIKDTDTPFGTTLNEIILSHVKIYGFPVCFDFPAGHIDDNRALVLGKKSELIVHQKKVRLIN